MPGEASGDARLASPGSDAVKIIPGSDAAFSGRIQKPVFALQR